MTTPERVLLTLTISGGWHTIADLATSLRVSRREVEAAVEQLRLAGNPVIGGSSGVRWTNSAAEVREYAMARRHRLASIAKGTRALLQASRRMSSPGEQTELWAA